MFNDPVESINNDPVAASMGLKADNVGEEGISTFRMKLRDQSDPVVSKSLALVLNAAKSFNLPVGTLKAEAKDGHLQMSFVTQMLS